MKTALCSLFVQREDLNTLMGALPWHRSSRRVLPQVGWLLVLLLFLPGFLDLYSWWNCWFLVLFYFPVCSFYPASSPKTKIFDSDWFKSDRIERMNTEAIKYNWGVGFFFPAEKGFNLKMGNTEFCYFHILEADQTTAHQNTWLWHFGSARNWTLAISRNLHKTLGAAMHFWGRARPCCHWSRSGSSLSQSPLFFPCFQQSVYSGSVYALAEWWFKLSNYFLSIAAQIIEVILMWLKWLLLCWF